MTKKPPETRLSLIIILVFGLVASKGIDILDQASSSTAAVRPVLTAAGVRDAESRAPDLDTSGVRLYARTEAAAAFLGKPLTTDTVGPADEAVTAVLRVWPLAGVFWLRLAEIRAASGADMQAVIEAYRLSVLAAPFDGRMMLARQLLGVQLWDVLSTDDQRSVVTDLVAVWDQRPSELTDRLRAATEGLSPQGRKTMRAVLQSRSTLPDRQLAAIGL